MSSAISKESLMKAILKEFCKQNFTFTNSMRLVGSIHVVVDNNEVLSVLLNETIADKTLDAHQSSVKHQINNETDSRSSSSSQITGQAVVRLNKRKRFVPRAHFLNALGDETKENEENCETFYNENINESACDDQAMNIDEDIKAYDALKSTKKAKIHYFIFLLLKDYQLQFN